MWRIWWWNFKNLNWEKIRRKGRHDQNKCVYKSVVCKWQSGNKWIFIRSEEDTQTYTHAHTSYDKQHVPFCRLLSGHLSFCTAVCWAHTQTWTHIHTQRMRTYGRGVKLVYSLIHVLCISLCVSNSAQWLIFASGCRTVRSASADTPDRLFSSPCGARGRRHEPGTCFKPHELYTNWSKRVWMYSGTVGHLPLDSQFEINLKKRMELKGTLKGINHVEITAVFIHSAPIPGPHNVWATWIWRTKIKQLETLAKF